MLPNLSYMIANFRGRPGRGYWETLNSTGQALSEIKHLKDEKRCLPQPGMPRWEGHAFSSSVSKKKLIMTLVRDGKELPKWG